MPKPNDPLDGMNTMMPGEEPPEPVLAAGTTLDKYRIVRLLGRGGMGVVYEAEHSRLRTRCALKVLSPAIRSHPDFIARFEQEARVMAQLAHPHIARVVDLGENGDWLEMELADGVVLPDGERAVSLADLADAHDGRLEQTLVADIMRQLLEGLAFAHERGAVHRDLKPANILLFGGDAEKPIAKIADFGLVRLVGEDWVRSQAELSMSRSASLGDRETMGGNDEGGTSTRSLLGTYDYMSPEQKEGEPTDKPSDVYAMGLILFRLLTGERSLGFDLPSHLDETLNPEWDGLVRCALNPRAEGRYADAAAMLEALAAVGPQGRRPERRGASVVKPEPVAEPKPVKNQLPPGLEPVANAEYASVAGLAEGSAEAQERQRQAMEAWGWPLEVCAGKTGILFRLIPAGTFTMGSPENEPGREDDQEMQHEVTLTTPFYLAKFPVMHEQWEAVMRNRPWRFLNPGREAPVEQVSWDDCQEFVAKLSGLEGPLAGYEYRLPTEAEWEYACRAGTQTALYNGDLASAEGVCPNLDQVGWYAENSDDATHPGGGKAPNAWGLYDMLGNVWEWCFDWSDDYPASAMTDPVGPREGSLRVLRGGSWYGNAGYCRAADRFRGDPADSYDFLGFRVALAPTIKRK